MQVFGLFITRPYWQIPYIQSIISKIKLHFHSSQLILLCKYDLFISEEAWSHCITSSSILIFWSHKIFDTLLQRFSKYLTQSLHEFTALYTNLINVHFELFNIRHIRYLTLKTWCELFLPDHIICTQQIFHVVYNCSQAFPSRSHSEDPLKVCIWEINNLNLQTG